MFYAFRPALFGGWIRHEALVAKLVSVPMRIKLEAKSIFFAQFVPSAPSSCTTRDMFIHFSASGRFGKAL
jgi:hypothetical protein